MNGKVPQSSARRNPRTQSRGTAPIVVKVFEPLRSSPAGRLEVRIIEVRRGERRLDIRQFLESDGGFTGFTRRGVCLTTEELDVLLAQSDVIRKLLGGGR